MGKVETTEQKLKKLIQQLENRLNSTSLSQNEAIQIQKELESLKK